MEPSKTILIDILDRFAPDNYAALPVQNGTLVVSFKPYKPYDYSKYPDCLQIDSYYPTSNKAYFESLNLMNELIAAGFDAKRYRRTDVKKQLVAYHLADSGLNTLCYTETHGSFFFVATVFLENFQTEFFSTLPLVEKPLCDKCGLCTKVCPNAALTTEGIFLRGKCLRQMQESYENTPAVNAALKKSGKFLGCNLCQLSCPLNAKIQTISPPEEIIRLCDRKNLLYTLDTPEQIERLIPFLGKNYVRKNFLRPIAQALVGDGE